MKSSLGSNGSTRLDMGFSKKFHESVGFILCIARMFSDFLPFSKNLRAIEGISPVVASLRLFVSDSLSMTVSDPES